MGIFKGDSYIGGSLGIARNLDVFGRVHGLITPPDAPYFISAPRGGGLSSTSSSVSGYLRIRLPVSITSNMIKFKVSIFDYTDDASLELSIAGYNAASWSRTTALLISGLSAKALSVRYGSFSDGGVTYNAVYIGEAATAWAYPQVRVHDLLVGYNGPSLETWSKNWKVEITTSLGTITATETATLPVAKWG